MQVKPEACPGDNSTINCRCWTDLGLRGSHGVPPTLVAGPLLFWCGCEMGIPPSAGSQETPASAPTTTLRGTATRISNEIRRATASDFCLVGVSGDRILNQPHQTTPGDSRLAKISSGPWGIAALESLRMADSGKGSCPIERAQLREEPCLLSLLPCCFES